LGLIVVSGLLGNIFIVGINQLVDVEIDKINGKNFPIATGDLSWELGRDIVGFSLISGITMAYLQSMLWGHVVACMCMIGFVYSVPPIRLKRFAIPAALCIVLARGVLGTVGGALAYAEAMGKPLDDFALKHLKIFTTVMVVFTCVIAIMKDVPDVEGDMKENVVSLSVIFGPSRVSDICFGLVSGVYAWIIWLGISQGVIPVAFTHLFGLIWLWGRSVSSGPNDYGWIRRVAIHNYLNVIWPLFYYEFFAYLVPIGLEVFGFEIPNYSFTLVLGLEVGYVWLVEPNLELDANALAVIEQIRSKSGLDIASIHSNLRLKGINPALHESVLKENLVSEAAVEMAAALSMHSRLTRLPGKVYDNAKKLSILCGDWLLAKAVIALCETNSQQAIHEMGKSIASATSLNQEERIVDVIMAHAEIAKESS
jgi:homogentisate phytyltransferase/homogentisate geranylgeranyltransferase